MLQIKQYLKHLDIISNDHIADLGCGVGHSSMLIAQEYKCANVYSIDVSEESLQNAKNLLDSKMLLSNKEEKDNYKKIEFIWGDIEEKNGTRLADKSIDKAIIENTFLTLKSKKSFLLELKRILKLGGIILISDFKTQIGKSSSHKNTLIDQEDVERLFVDAGFIVYPIDSSETEKTQFIFLAKIRE